MNRRITTTGSGICWCSIKEPKEKPPLTKTVLLAVLRCFFWLGLVREGRAHFWRVFLWVCFHKRESVQNFLGLAILGYHFRKIHEDLLGRPQAGPTREGFPQKQTQLPRPASFLVK